MKYQKEFLEKLTKLLENCGIDYAVCGSLSSSLYGQPRATNDADIIISPTQEQFTNLIETLKSGYYISQEAAYEAMRLGSMFNVIDNELGWKADMILLKPSHYHLTEFNRRIRTRLMGVELWIQSPEDVILSKLNWSKDTGSQLQYMDVFGVIKLQWDKLNWEYLHKWAKELGTEEKLESIKAEVEKLRKKQ